MAVNNSLVAKGNQKMGITAYLTAENVRKQIDSVIGQSSGKFVTAIVSAVNNNQQLQECSNQSILSAALLGQSLNLSPSPQLGMYYMVPYKDKDRGMVAQFQIGYKGLIQLAVRTGVYKKLNALAIKEGELKSYDPLNEEISVELIQNEEAREKAPTIGYYAMFEYTNGFRKTLYWSKSKMLAHAERYSKAFAAHKGYTFWEKDFDSMALKTMIRQLISHWGVMSPDFEKAYTADQGVINDDGSVCYVDNDSSVVESPAPAEPKEEPIMPPPVEPEVAENSKKKSAPITKADEEDAEAIAKALFK